MAGFEGADHINSRGTALDLGALTQHRQNALADYQLLQEFGIATVRESVGWRLVEEGGRFDFSSLASRIDAARRCDIQILWTLCHYGMPADVDVFADSFIDRFASFCAEVSRFLTDQLGAGLTYTPLNEISFFTWALCDSTLMYPHRGNRGHEGNAVKRRLVRAAIEGCEAIWKSDPAARIITIDPVIHVIAPDDRPDLAEAARQYRNSQFEAWDMLAGAIAPELGGHARYLGILGVNYYHSNQWEIASMERLHWHLHDPRRTPFHALLKETYQRYRAPLIVAETSHVGVGRAEWLHEIAGDVAIALSEGTPVHGLCLYPIIDRPDWDNLNHWHNSGLWDVEPAGNQLTRRICEPYAQELRLAQQFVSSSVHTTQ